jgi:hypothetical protein
MGEDGHRTDRPPREPGSWTVIRREMSGAEYSFWKARSMLASFHDPATLLTDRTARDRLFEPIEEQKIWRWTL